MDGRQAKLILPALPKARVLRWGALLSVLWLLTASTAHAEWGFSWTNGWGMGQGKSGQYVDLVTVHGFANYTTYAFGNITTGTTRTKTFTYQSTGNAPLESASLAVAGSGFTLASTTCGTNPFDLAAGGTCTATVQFAPVAAAGYTGTLTASAPNLTNQVINCTGTGYAACDDTVGMLIAEDAEGAGTPSGWSNTGTGVSWDYTSAVLRGAQSLYIPSGATTPSASKTFTASGEIWTHHLIQVSALVANDYFLYLGSSQYNLRSYDTGGTIRASCGTAAASSISGVLSANTTYHVWTHIIAGTGSNATCDTYVGTTTSRPASPTIHQTNGTITGTLGSIQFTGNGAGNANKIIDQIRVSNSSFTSVCP